MTRKTSSYHQALLESLADPKEAAEYLNAAIEDSPESFLKALGNVVQAAGQMAKVAKEANIQRETLYRAFTANGNPRFDTLTSVLSAVKLRLSISPAEEKVAEPPTVSYDLVKETAPTIGNHGMVFLSTQVHLHNALLSAGDTIGPLRIPVSPHPQIQGCGSFLNVETR